MRYGFYGGILLLSVFTIVSMIRVIIFGHNFGKYLREKHYEKWKYLTTLPGLGPGWKNDPRVLKFLFSKDDLGDPELLCIKVIYRNSIIYTIMGMIAIFIVVAMMFRFYPET